MARGSIERFVRWFYCVEEVTVLAANKDVLERVSSLQKHNYFFRREGNQGSGHAWNTDCLMDTRSQSNIQTIGGHINGKEKLGACGIVRRNHDASPRPFGR